MSDSISRRLFTAATAGALLGSAADLAAADDKPKADPPKVPAVPMEAAFERDYPVPSFKPSWKKPQVNRQPAFAAQSASGQSRQTAKTACWLKQLKTPIRSST